MSMQNVLALFDNTQKLPSIILWIASSSSQGELDGENCFQYNHYDLFLYSAHFSTHQLQTNMYLNTGFFWVPGQMFFWSKTFWLDEDTTGNKTLFKNTFVVCVQELLFH